MRETCVGGEGVCVCSGESGNVADRDGGVARPYCSSTSAPASSSSCTTTWCPWRMADMRAVCPCEFCALMFAEYCEGRGGRGGGED